MTFKNLLIPTILFTLCFSFSININAQDINQFDKSGKRTGVWRKYYSNQRIRYEGKFVNGKEVGVFKYYDITTSKHPVIIKEFSANSNMATVTYYTLNGKLRSKGKMRGKLRVGKWIYYFENKALFSEENYVKGKLDGELKNYYKNGKLLEVTSYLNGIKHGESKKYSEEGTLLEHVQFRNGKLNGKAFYYELNGNLKEEGIYKNGKKIGEWQFYIDGEKASLKDKIKSNTVKLKNN